MLRPSLVRTGVGRVVCREPMATDVSVETDESATVKTHRLVNVVENWAGLELP